MTKRAVMEAAPATAVRVEATEAAGEAGGRDRVPDEALIADELLVEEVSIDGMCGVY